MVTIGGSYFWRRWYPPAYRRSTKTGCGIGHGRHRSTQLGVIFVWAVCCVWFFIHIHLVVVSLVLRCLKEKPSYNRVSGPILMISYKDSHKDIYDIYQDLPSSVTTCDLKKSTKASSLRRPVGFGAGIKVGQVL